MAILEGRDVSAPFVSDESRLQQAPRISAAWCGDELVLLDAATGRYFTLNRVGGRMWELLATSRSTRELVVSLRTEYDVPPEPHDATLQRDVVRMLDGMCVARLLVAENLRPAAESPASSPWRHG